MIGDEHMSLNNSPYYELDKIKPYRLLLIDQAVEEFKKEFGIKDVPVDCVKLARKMNCTKDYNIRVKSTTLLHPTKLAETIYIRNIGMYLVSVNRSQLYDAVRKRLKYPFRCSSDRMVNFTLGHEFGHIFLKHALIPDSQKTPEIKDEENLESNEFAGRLFMPKTSLESCNLNSLSKIAAKFLVSEQAVLKRLTHLKHHDKGLSKVSFR